MKDGFLCGGFKFTSWFYHEVHFRSTSSSTFQPLFILQVMTCTNYRVNCQRLVDICLTDSAIFIAPDYRLLPEATGAEVLDDVEDFWRWLHNTLPTLTTTWNAFPDLTRLACTGQSAGGYLAVQSALLFPELSQIKVVASMGGSLNTDIPYCRIPGPRVILGRRPPPPGKAESIVRTYVRNIKPQTVRTSGNVVDMWDFLTCVLQQAYLARWFGAMGKEELDVMKMLERVKAMPPSKHTLKLFRKKKISSSLPIWSRFMNWAILGQSQKSCPGMIFVLFFWKGNLIHPLVFIS